MSSAPENDYDVVNKKYVDEQIANLLYTIAQSNMRSTDYSIGDVIKNDVVDETLNSWL